MGIWDNVNYSVQCPFCGKLITKWYTKEREDKMFNTLESNQVKKYMRGICENMTCCARIQIDILDLPVIPDKNAEEGSQEYEAWHILEIQKTMPIFAKKTTENVDNDKNKDNEALVNINESVNESQIVKPPLLGFHDDNKLVGALNIVDGKLIFEGNAEQSASLFFDDFFKEIVDNYIAQETENDGK